MNRGSDIQGKVLHGFTVRRYVGRLYVFVACIALLWPVCVCAQPRKVQNLPYVDHKLLHLGFSIGTHVQDMKLYIRVSLPMVEKVGTWIFPIFHPGSM